MKINKALKLKNRKIKDIQTLVTRIDRSNVYTEGNEPAYDIKKLLNEYNESKDDLIKLKVAIQTTNLPIYEKMVKLAELKDDLKVLGRLSTLDSKERKSFHYGSEREIVSYSVITTTEKDEMEKSMQDEIDRLQEEIDTFNATIELKGYS